MNDDALKVLEVSGDWALRTHLTEGDRYWTRVQHWLTVNSLLAAALAVMLASVSLSAEFKGGALLAVGSTAAVLNWTWLAILARGARWHRIFGERFHEINRALLEARAEDVASAAMSALPSDRFALKVGGRAVMVPTVFPEGVYLPDKDPRRKAIANEVNRAGGILRLTRLLSMVFAIAWSAVGLSALICWGQFLMRGLANP